MPEISDHIGSSTANETDPDGEGHPDVMHTEVLRRSHELFTQARKETKDVLNDPATGMAVGHFTGGHY